MQNTQSIDPKTLKHTLWEIMRQSISAAEWEKVMKELPAHLGISKAQLKKYIYARKDGNTELSFSKAVAICDYFSAHFDIIIMPATLFNL